MKTVIKFNSGQYLYSYNNTIIDTCIEYANALILSDNEVTNVAEILSKAGYHFELVKA
jgi:uncharacterized membrane protein YjjP (DUF1212 family)